MTLLKCIKGGLLGALLLPAQLFAQQGVLSVRPGQDTGYMPYFTMPVGSEDGNIHGKPIKPFSLVTPDGKALVSGDMKGKVIVLDFWATWCSPCRTLTHELDSVLRPYQGRSDFEMIGVNYRESVVNKGNDPVTYWKSHGYHFPMTKNDTSYGKTIAAGNPTVVVIDREGIVRGRWDAWTPSTSKEIAGLVWAVVNDPVINGADISGLLDKGEAVEVLHLCDQVMREYPQQVSAMAPLKFSAWVHVSTSGAMDALAFIKPVLDTCADYIGIGKAILGDSGLDSHLSRDEVFDKLMRTYHGTAFVYDQLSGYYEQKGQIKEAVKSEESALVWLKDRSQDDQTVKMVRANLERLKKEL